MTDHKALTTLLTPKGEGRKPLRLFRWADRLFAYDFEIEFKPGTQQVAPDFLSRYGYSTAHVTECNLIADDFDDSVYIMQLNSSTVSPDDLITATDADETLQTVKRHVLHGWPKTVTSELKPYHAVRDELSLWANSKCLARSNRAVIPSSLHHRVLETAHQGHLGIVKTKARCRETVWWPGLNADLKTFIKNCSACIESEKCFKFPQVPWGKT